MNVKRTFVLDKTKGHYEGYRWHRLDRCSLDRTGWSCGRLIRSVGIFVLYGELVVRVNPGERSGQDVPR